MSDPLTAEDLAAIRRALGPGGISPYTDSEAMLARSFLATLDEVIGILTRYEHSVMVDSTELRRSVAARLGVEPRCGFPSSVTDATCVLPAGHPADSPTRFHRFPRP